MERTERFRYVRQTLGHSFRGMSAAIDGSSGLWVQYETGRRLPSYEVLERLCALGVNVDWLVSGRGSAFIDEPPALSPRPGDGFGHIIKALELVLKNHDMERFSLWSTIVGFLSRSMEGLSIDQLAELMQVPPSDPELRAQLAWLQNQGLLGLGNGVYRLIRSSYSLEGKGAEFQGLLAMRDLLSSIIPAVRDGVGRSKLMRIAETSTSGPILERLNELVKQIRLLDSEAIAQPRSAGNKTFQLVYAYLVTE